MLLAVNHTLNNNFDATTNGAQHGILTLKYLPAKNVFNELVQHN